MFNLEKSPIRENIKELSDDMLSVFEDDALLNESGDKYTKLQVRTILKDVENMLVTLEGNKDKNIKIAVLGEVKAGKSTFVNVCAEKAVAYTDILEATAIVSEITYSEEEYVHILDTNGQIVKEFTTEELLEWTEELLDEGADFLQFGKIEIGINNDFFKNMILVDTPGLLSITSKNHDITNQYIAQTDYILWVINSRDLGSKTVNDFIDKIKLSGKPLIGIVNKVDSEDERKEIEEYINKEYGNIFEDIYFVSSMNAWNAIVSGDADWTRKTGFEDVIECIKDLSEGREYSTDKTQYYQLQREREVHLKMKERIKIRKEYYDKELAMYAHVNMEIQKVVRKELNHWIENELYVDERQELISAKGQEFSKLFDQYKDPVYLTKVLDDKYNEVLEFIYKKWQIIVSSLTVNSDQVLVDFQYDKNIDLDFEEKQFKNADVILSEGAKKGLKSGTVLGLFFAGYSAWLGPAASTITFASQIVPCVLPLVIGGVLLGNYLSNHIDTEAAEQNARKKQEAVEDLYKNVLEVVALEGKKIEKNLIACSNHYYEERCSVYKEKVALLHFDFTEPWYGAFYKRLDAYIADLNEEIERLSNNDIPEPPSTENLKYE